MPGKKIGGIWRGEFWGAWDVELAKPGEASIKTRACDFQSAADDPFGANAVVFSVWF